MNFWARLFTRNLRTTQPNDTQTALVAYWSTVTEQILSELSSSPNGLSQADAERRLLQYGANSIQVGSQTTALTVPHKSRC